jgi:hypothetical protein
MPRTCGGAPRRKRAPHDDRGPAKDTESPPAPTVARNSDLAEQLARRHEAALRLPPLDCGCHDPETWEHWSGQCRYRRSA